MPNFDVGDKSADDTNTCQETSPANPQKSLRKVAAQPLVFKRLPDPVRERVRCLDYSPKQIINGFISEYLFHFG